MRAVFLLLENRDFAARARDSPLEFRARSVFYVLLRGFSSKTETARSRRLFKQQNAIEKLRNGD